jgi:hypothetical protein
MVHPRLPAALVTACLVAAPSVHASTARPVLIDVAAAPLGTNDAFAAETRACIARASAEAAAHCDTAVGIAETELHATRASAVALYTARAARGTLAIALSNRAVVRWLQGRPGAGEDIARAARLAPREDFVAINAAVLSAPRDATLAAR